MSAYIIGGVDYEIPDLTELNLLFGPGRNRDCFDVPIIDDLITEETETFVITLPEMEFPDLNVTVDTNPVTVTIEDNDGT